MQFVGIDSGGTFTDTVIVDDVGQVAVGKALSTPGRLEVGVLESIRQAATALGRDLEGVLSTTDVLAHGTTAGINALLTRQGARVGLLVTEGFEDTLPIARGNKAVGLDEADFNDATRWSKPELLVPRRRTFGIRERIDKFGAPIVRLDENQARAQVARLAETGVDAVAISFLWSFLDPSHERRVRDLVLEVMPDVTVTLSSELVPRIGEYERTLTTVLNAYVAPVVSKYLHDLDRELSSVGFAGAFLVTKSSRGVQQASRIADRPIETLISGPVGGISAAINVGRYLGHHNIISSDVGGTSFDVGIVVDGEPEYALRPMIERYHLAIPVVGIESIGTGGGSIAWLDEGSGALRVGPRSAGAEPGPVCYGRGGGEPTVTDAAVVLGYLHRLGGDLDLDREAAKKVIESAIAEPMGTDVHAAAEGILAVSNAQMADLMRRTTVHRGHDPRDFVVYAFGGAAPQYVGRYAADLGAKTAVIPAFASVFSAYGAVASDVRASIEFDAPAPFPPPLDWVQASLDDLEARAIEELAASRSDRERQVNRSIGFRFRRQVHELRIPIPSGPVTDDVLDQAARQFFAEYERLFGSGTAYSDAGIETVGFRVEVSIPMRTPTPVRLDCDDTEPVGRRRAWFDGGETDVPVFDGNRLAAGVVVEGPAFVDQPTTTLVVYPGQRCQIDDMGNIVMHLQGDDR